VLGSLGLLSLVGAAPAQAADSFKAVWVWKDRIREPDELADFCERYRVATLFLYLTPWAGEAVLAGSNGAREVLTSLKANGRRVYACVGEPDWVFDPTQLPDHLGLAVRAVSGNFFDGLHLDVEPQALPEWHETGARARLLAGTLRLFNSVRSALPHAEIDAALNPIFATLPFEGEMFLTALARRLSSVSVMAYRNKVPAAISWATPAIREISRVSRRWRLGVLVDSNPEEPGTSFAGVPRQAFMVMMDGLDSVLKSRFSELGYSGLAFEGYDGLRLLLGKADAI
jgi:hypothetical protein